MEVNWWVIAVVVIFALILIVFLIKRNRKDEKELEVFLNKEDIQKDESEFKDIE
jgi:uncharacterized integral membrane protein